MKPSGIIREYGWVQHKDTGIDVTYFLCETPVDQCGGFNISTAMVKAAYMMELKDPSINFPEVYDEWRAKIKATLPIDDSLFSWNDHPERTKNEVIAKLEEVGL